MKIGFKKAIVCSLALAVAAIGGSYPGFAQDKEKDKKKAAKSKDDEARAAKLKEKQEEFKKLQKEIAELGGVPPSGPSGSAPGAPGAGGPGDIQGVDMEAMQEKMKEAMRGGGRSGRPAGMMGPGSMDFSPPMGGDDDTDPIHASRRGMAAAVEAQLQYLGNLIKGAASQEERDELIKEFEEQAERMVQKRKSLRESEIKRLEKRLAELKDPKNQNDPTVDELKAKHIGELEAIPAEAEGEEESDDEKSE